MRTARSADESLPELFLSVTRSLRHDSLESLAGFGVTPAQARALRVLSRHGSMRLSELSAHLRIAPRSVTEVVDDLEGKDLVRRRPDPYDRRATVVELTPTGTSTTDTIAAARVADAERTFERLTEHERETLARLLTKLRD
jgi:DNA-binding MarR family transcriptional regulator